MSSLLRSVRFAWRWVVPRPLPHEDEVLIPLGDAEPPVPGTFVRVGRSTRSAGWIVLHGMTRPGPAHPELLRFARAVAATGAPVLVPEFRDWRELRFAPERAQRVLRAAIEWLRTSPENPSGGVVLGGFSFGAPQAIRAASDPALAPHLRGVVSWGGYADVARTFRFLLTGEHEWEGEIHRADPDPYGRWIVGANALPVSPTYRDRTAVVEALFALAREAGDRRLPAADPALDPRKEELRRRLSPEDRTLFDLFVPPAGATPDPAATAALAETLAVEVPRAIPLLDPIPGIVRIPVPVRLVHGRNDHLIPFTETLRLERTLRPATDDLETRITALYAHSAGSRGGSLLARAREIVRFLEVLRRVLEIG